MEPDNAASADTPVPHPPLTASDVNVHVITDQRDTDATYNAVDVADIYGVLEIRRAGKPVAWHAAGKWSKVDFS